MTLQAIKLTLQPLKDGTKQLKLESWYHPSLPAKAKAIGGRWHAETKTWRFDPRDEARVREMCLAVYGVDPFEPPAELVTVRVPLGRQDDIRELWLGGRCVAARPDRDSAVRLGDGVVQVAGSPFGGYGGSRANPRLAISDSDGIILEIRDIPAAAADKILAQRPGSEIVATTEAPIGRPVGPTANGVGAYSPEITAVVEAFRALSATQQAIALAALAEIMPEVVR